MPSTKACQNNVRKALLSESATRIAIRHIPLQSRDTLAPASARTHCKVIYLLLLSTGSFQKAGKFVLSSKLWEHSTPSKTCDVLITFPKDTEDYTVMWLLSRLRARVPDIDVHVRQMAHSPVYGFYLTSSFEVIFNFI